MGRTSREPRGSFMSATPPVKVGEHAVPAGSRRRVDVPIGRLPIQTEIALPVYVVHGAVPGPRIWLSAAIHGDELNGIEIVRRVLAILDAATLVGTVFAVPVVNVFGFLNGSRYLPDGRDLNRSFPGSTRGSLASRLARLFMTEIVSQCTHGIDFHTAGVGNVNCPQIRADLDDLETYRCARAFGAPVMLDARMRDGSLRQAATSRGIHVLLYEGGEPLKFDEDAIAAGVRGVLGVMAALGMRPDATLDLSPPVLECRRSKWVRARASGVLRLHVGLQQHVRKGQKLAEISDVFGSDVHEVRAPYDGYVLGLATNPLVSQGHALVHLGLHGTGARHDRPDWSTRHAMPYGGMAHVT